MVGFVFVVVVMWLVGGWLSDCLGLVCVFVFVYVVVIFGVLV